MPEKSETATQVESSAQLRGGVENRAPKPAGLLPKNTQQLVILSVAVVMVLIMWLTGGARGAKTTAMPPPAALVQPANPASVEDFKKTIQQQQAATRQPIARSSLERLQALGLAGDVSQGGVVLPPANTDIPQPGDIIGGATGQPLPPDPVREDRKKREYLSLFAPNVAFSNRNGQQPEPTVASGPKSINAPSQDDPQEPPLNNSEAQNRRAEAQLAAIGPATPVDAVGLATTVAPQKKQIIAESDRPKPDGPRLGAFNSFTGKRYIVFEGTVLETLLINRLNGSFSGPVNCMVTTDVFSHDRQHLLIPAGTKVLGEAKKVEALGQQRLAVFFHRIIMPDGYSLNLDQFKGLNQVGETALRDKVNNHYLQIFSASLAVGILGGIAQAGTGNALSNSPLDQARAGFGSNLANSSMQILDRFLNILPNLTIREGNRVKVYLSGDLLVPDYAQHTIQPDF